VNAAESNVAQVDVVRLVLDGHQHDQQTVVELEIRECAKKPQIPHIIILIINKLTTRQPGILWRWSGRLEQSTIGHSFGTYIINFQKHAQDTSFLAFLLH